MKRNWLIMIVASILSLTFITGCGTMDNDNEPVRDEVPGEQPLNPQGENNDINEDINKDMNDLGDDIEREENTDMNDRTNDTNDNDVDKDRSKNNTP